MKPGIDERAKTSRALMADRVRAVAERAGIEHPVTTRIASADELAELRAKAERHRPRRARARSSGVRRLCSSVPAERIEARTMSRPSGRAVAIDPARHRPEWRAARAAVLTPGAVCEIRLPGCTNIADVVDHVIPASVWERQYGSLDGVNDVSNLRPACSACNAAKSGRLSAGTFDEEHASTQPVRPTGGRLR